MSRDAASPTRRLPSLRTELLLSVAILAVAALAVAVFTMLLFGGYADAPFAAPLLTALVFGDVLVFVALGAYLLRRFLLHPLDEIVRATEAIANGDLRRRVPEAASSELQTLADSINRMTDRLLEERAQLVQAEKLASIGRLAAGVAHEIGNPLGAINGYAHILRVRTGALENGDVNDALAGLDRESARIDRIVRGLLDFARPRRVTPTPVDVEDVLRGAVALLADQGATRGVDVQLEIDNSAPRVFGERHELEQAIINLLLNAVDAIGGKGTIVVRCDTLLASALRDAQQDRVRAWSERLERDSSVAHIAVQDSGPGIPPDDRERVFDPFFTTKAPGKGTGLGLAIVQRIVENHHGIVWADAAPLGGASIEVAIPLVRGLSARGMPTQRASAPRGSALAVRAGNDA